METTLAIAAAVGGYVYFASCIGAFLAFNNRPQHPPRNNPDRLGEAQGEAGSFHNSTLFRDRN